MMQLLFAGAGVQVGSRIRPRAEGKRAVEIIADLVPVVRGANRAAKFPGMLGVIQKGGVLKFVAILNVGYAEPAAAVPSKRSANIHGRPGLQRRVLVVGMNKLEPRLGGRVRSDEVGGRC